MALGQFAQLSSRFGAFTTLQATASDAQNADFNSSGSLPNGFGDCIIYGYTIRSNVTTAAALTSADGVYPYLVGAGGTGAILQSIQPSQWYKVASGEFNAGLLIAGKPVLWRTQEQFGVKYRATATDATGGTTIEVYVLRTRAS